MSPSVSFTFVREIFSPGHAGLTCKDSAYRRKKLTEVRSNFSGEADESDIDSVECASRVYNDEWPRRVRWPCRAKQVARRIAIISGNV
jgi:hypothetical protein